MSTQEKQIRLEGIVHASRFDPDAQGKQFLGATIECSDATWVIDHEEQSPFHVLAGHQVVAFGEPYKPEGQHLISRGGDKKLGHFHVSILQPAELTSGAELVEVGARFDLDGRFELASGDTAESTFLFITGSGEVFAVANDPAGASVGRSVEVSAYPVHVSPSLRKRPERYLWIICPYSVVDLRDWRRRCSR